MYNYLDGIPPRFSVTNFLSCVNENLAGTFPTIEIVGEVSSFKISKNKWVFFDLKDEKSTISCFLPIFKLRQEIEDGMKIVVSGYPKITTLGKFSFTISNIKPVGEGNIKKSFELLKKKLEKEGLFALERKRKIPTNLASIGIISSITAAGYADFLKILDTRWGGIKILVANTGVQGLSATDEIIRALKYFNEKTSVDIIAIIRGGGSADDLAIFNDEILAREIARSKIPTITGIGHEIDVTIADLVADIRASTPSNAAELLTHDRKFELTQLEDSINHLKHTLLEKINSLSPKKDFSSLRDFLYQKISELSSENYSGLKEVKRKFISEIDKSILSIENQKRILVALNPETVLDRGYAILTGKISPGEEIEITTNKNLINAKVTYVKPRN